MKEAENAIDGAMKTTSQAVDQKMQEANQYVDQKRENLEKTIHDTATHAQESAGNQAANLLGKLNLAK